MQKVVQTLHKGFFIFNKGRKTDFFRQPVRDMIVNVR